MRLLRATTLCAAAVAALVLGIGLPTASAQTKTPAKNVILMVADGAGFNTWHATSMYQGRWDAAKKKSKQVYDGPGWAHYACSTFPLDTADNPTESGVQDAKLIYSPAQAWNGQQAYEWLNKTYTDSAAAATALSTGNKTYNNAINWSDLNKPLTPTMSEAAKAAGKAVGVITTVEWSHATPSGLSNAHNVDRDNYVEIAKHMVEGGVMDVIMGAGNPDFNNDAAPVTGKTKKEYKYVGGAPMWKAVEQARTQPGGTYQGFRPVSTKAEFEALMSGPTPAKVLGTAQVATTLQQARKAGKSVDDPAADSKLNANLPTLVTMTKAAINVLDNRKQGFFLLIEGGAVDWANHKNQAGRMIREHAEFIDTVQAVVEWVETHSNWQETLLVITADHETGMLWGPQSDTVPFDPIVYNGPGKMPGLKYNSKKHTNSLVPVYAKGAGSEKLAQLVAGKDPVRGPYVDNTSVAKVLKHAAAGIPFDAPQYLKPKVDDKSQWITVASYYFPNYHPGDPRNEKSKGKGWAEWELVKAAKPRFPGHHQPNVPAWGYTDESDPKAMAQKIDAAVDHGVDAFIFDWYYYDDGPFLQRCLDEGFLKAPNVGRMKFAFMWANHDWIELHPYKRNAPRTVLYPGKVTPEGFERICDHVIKDYFQHASYWRIDGKPYFSFYDLTRLLESFGSVKATRAALDKFRTKAKAAGLPGLHLNAVVWGRTILPNEKTVADPAKLVTDLGFDSVTSYVWIHHVALPQMQTDFDLVRDKYFEYWDKAKKQFKQPYFPNVTMGWDSSPRANQADEYGNWGYPFTHTISGNTPERFREALRLTKERLLSQKGGPRVLNINCWNEWTEGSYLEPDTVHGMKYLEAVRDVFGTRSQRVAQ